MVQSVRVVRGPVSNASRRLHKLYLDLHSSPADEAAATADADAGAAAGATSTYKMHFASARERDVWAEILAAYGEYRQYGASAAAAAASEGADSSSSASGPTAAGVAAGVAAAVPYSAYTIPAIYVRALQSCFDMLVGSRAFEREGLFRTGRSSPLLLRQLLLNNGLLEGGRWGRKAGLAAATAGPGLGLDPHTVAFVAKSLLRSLPETILTNALLQHVFHAAGQFGRCRRSASRLTAGAVCGIGFVSGREWDSHRCPTPPSLCLFFLSSLQAATTAHC